jgi:hypothetical protein
MPNPSLFRWPKTWLMPCAMILALMASGCTIANVGELRWEQAPDPNVVAKLEPGVHDLQDCMNLIGAPLEVQKDEDELRRVLTWHWMDSLNWNFSVSVPIADQSASYQYGRNKRKVQQLQLIFDSDWQLLEVLSEGSR